MKEKGGKNKNRCLKIDGVRADAHAVGFNAVFNVETGPEPDPSGCPKSVI